MDCEPVAVGKHAVCQFRFHLLAYLRCEHVGGHAFRQFGRGKIGMSFAILYEALASFFAQAGEELVGLCYFGDQPSRERIESQLALGSTSNS